MLSVLVPEVPYRQTRRCTDDALRVLPLAREFELAVNYTHHLNGESA